MAESILLGCVLVDGGYADAVVAASSSHNTPNANSACLWNMETNARLPPSGRLRPRERGHRKVAKSAFLLYLRHGRQIVDTGAVPIR